MKFKALRPYCGPTSCRRASPYANILGFELAERNGDWGWASLHRDEVEIVDSTGTMTGSLQFLDSFYATDVTATLTGTMLVIDGTMWNPLRTMDITVRNFSTAGMPHTYNFTNISEGSVNYIGNGIKNSAHGSITIQGITSGVMSGSYSATMTDSSTMSGTFKVKYN